MLCKYKNALGEPKKGIHKYRFFNIAIVDVILTVIAAGILSYFFKWRFWITLLILFLLGIIAHRIFCVKSTVDIALFSS
jgi:fatty acid desaturase